MAGLLPRPAQRAAWRPPAEPGGPPALAGLGAAGELRRQAAVTQEPHDGSSSGEPQGSEEMSGRRGLTVSVIQLKNM